MACAHPLLVLVLRMATDSCVSRCLVPCADIWHVAPQFRGYQQHDSQDFLRAIVDNMHDGGNITSPATLSTSCFCGICSAGMKLLYEYEYNPAAAKLEASHEPQTTCPHSLLISMPCIGASG